MLNRDAEHPVDPVFLSRWSPRAFTGEPVSEAQCAQLFEAAKWAPSSYNGQPWRFLYARRNTPAWDKFFALLVEFNQKWAKQAGLLIVIISRTTFERNGKPSRTHSFDAGAAWENLALQASIMGLAAHGMEGFDYDRAARELGIPADYQVEAMAAVGKPAPADTLPEDLREREKPSDRKPLAAIAAEGRFSFAE